MGDINQARQQTAQARAELEQRKQESAQAQEQLQKVRQSLPERTSQRALRQKFAGLQGRQSRIKILKAEQEIQRKQELVNQYNKELEPYEESISQAERQIQEYDLEENALKKAQNLIADNMAGAYVQFGEDPRVKRYLEEYLTQQKLNAETQEYYLENPVKVQEQIENLVSKGLTEKQAYSKLGLKLEPTEVKDIPIIKDVVQDIKYFDSRTLQTQTKDKMSFSLFPFVSAQPTTNAQLENNSNWVSGIKDRLLGTRNLTLPNNKTIEYIKPISAESNLFPRAETISATNKPEYQEVNALGNIPQKFKQAGDYFFDRQKDLGNLRANYLKNSVTEISKIKAGKNVLPLGILFNEQVSKVSPYINEAKRQLKENMSNSFYQTSSLISRGAEKVSPYGQRAFNKTKQASERFIGANIFLGSQGVTTAREGLETAYDYLEPRAEQYFDKRKGIAQEEVKALTKAGEFGTQQQINLMSISQPLKERFIETNQEGFKQAKRITKAVAKTELQSNLQTSDNVLTSGNFVFDKGLKPAGSFINRGLTDFSQDAFTGVKATGRFIDRGLTNFSSDVVNYVIKPSIQFGSYLGEQPIKAYKKIPYKKEIVSPFINANMFVYEQSQYLKPASKYALAGVKYIVGLENNPVVSTPATKVQEDILFGQEEALNKNYTSYRAGGFVLPVSNSSSRVYRTFEGYSNLIGASYSDIFKTLDYRKEGTTFRPYSFFESETGFKPIIITKESKKADAGEFGSRVQTAFDVGTYFTPIATTKISLGLGESIVKGQTLQFIGENPEDVIFLGAEGVLGARAFIKGLKPVKEIKNAKQLKNIKEVQTIINPKVDVSLSVNEAVKTGVDPLGRELFSFEGEAITRRISPKTNRLIDFTKTRILGKAIAKQTDDLILVRSDSLATSISSKSVKKFDDKITALVRVNNQRSQGMFKSGEEQALGLIETNTLGTGNLKLKVTQEGLTADLVRARKPKQFKSLSISGTKEIGQSPATKQITENIFIEGTRTTSATSVLTNTYQKTKEGQTLLKDRNLNAQLGSIFEPKIEKIKADVFSSLGGNGVISTVEKTKSVIGAVAQAEANSVINILKQEASKPIIIKKVISESIIKPSAKQEILLPSLRNVGSAYAGLGQYERTSGGQSLMQVQETRDRDKDILGVNNISGTINLTKQDTTTKERNKDIFKFNEINKLNNNFRDLTKEKESLNSKQLQRQIQKQGQAQRQAQKQIQIQKQAQRQVVNTKPFIFAKPSKNLIERFTEKAETGELFEIFKKVKGKMVKVGEETDLFKAGKKLKTELKKDLSASGFVQSAGGTKVLARSLGIDTDFREGKSDIYKLVQRKGGKEGGRGRLSTSTEIREILGEKAKAPKTDKKSRGSLGFNFKNFKKVVNRKILKKNKISVRPKQAVYGDESIFFNGGRRKAKAELLLGYDDI